MPKKSAGLILYRFQNDLPEILLVHPGGPFWSKKDGGVWSIPKGEFEDGEDPLQAAIRETQEETGIDLNGQAASALFIELSPVKQKSGKMIYAWATETNFNTADFKCNLFEMEWPPKSGKKASFPEADKAEWFGLEDAKKKVTAGQIPLIQEFNLKLENRGSNN
jgi:predicted NUDIX family NTP pyrophosphohydrolase